MKQKTGTHFSLKKKAKNEKYKNPKIKKSILCGKSLKALDFWIVGFSFFLDVYEKSTKTNGNIWIFRIW